MRSKASDFELLSWLLYRVLRMLEVLRQVCQQPCDEPHVTRAKFGVSILTSCQFLHLAALS